MCNVASISPNLTSNFSSLRFERLLPERPFNALQIDIAVISEDGKIIQHVQTNMKHFLLLLLRNTGSITRSNFQRYGSMFPVTKSEIA